MKRGAPAGGFTYLGMIILLAILGLVGAAGLKMGTLLQRAAAEEELLEIGAQFSDALRSYAAATPQGKPQQPPSLQDLVKDPRFPNPRRHLRKIFVDPVSGKAEWGIVWLGEKEKTGVIGVYSLSDARPLKVANFDIRFQNMENKEKISDWKFGMAGGAGVPPLPANAMTGSGAAAPPSLFAGGKPGGTATAGKPEGTSVAIGTGMPQPAAPPVAEETPAEEVKPPEPEPEPPAEVQSDEEKEAEGREKAEEEEKARQEAAGGGATRSTVVPPVTPPPEGERRRR